MTDASLRAECDANFEAAFRMVVANVGDPRGADRRFGGALAIIAGLPLGYYNPVLALDPATSAEDVSDGIEWVRSFGLPSSVQLAAELESALGAACSALGLERDPFVSPGMAMSPVAPAPPGPPGLRIVRSDANNYDDWLDGQTATELFATAFPAAMLDDARVRGINAYVDEQPIGGAFMVRTGSTIGLYAVAVREGFRGRGFGRAISWQAMEACRDWGCSTAVLQSSEMGANMYRKMGFEDVSGYVEFSDPRP
jgi:GNAT superfamily N-acetyltransferase